MALKYKFFGSKNENLNCDYPSQNNDLKFGSPKDVSGYDYSTIPMAPLRPANGVVYPKTKSRESQVDVPGTAYKMVNLNIPRSMKLRCW